MVFGKNLINFDLSSCQLDLLDYKFHGIIDITKRRKDMGIFDGVFKKTVTTFLKDGDGWRQRQNDSPLDIEVCGGIAVADPTTRTYELCVAINKTIFKNTNKRMKNSICFVNAHKFRPC